MGVVAGLPGDVLLEGEVAGEGRAGRADQGVKARNAGVGAVFGEELPVDEHLEVVPGASELEGGMEGEAQQERQGEESVPHGHEFTAVAVRLFRGLERKIPENGAGGNNWGAPKLKTVRR